MEKHLVSCINSHSAVSASRSQERSSFSGMLKSIFILIVLLAGLSGDIQAGPPSSNISGPLVVYSNGGSIFLTSQIDAGQSPAISYSLLNNTSGAFIVSQGSLQFDSSTGIGTQTIEVNPGSSKGSFNVQLTVTNAEGTGGSSKSVTVITKLGASNVNIH